MAYFISYTGSAFAAHTCSTDNLQDYPIGKYCCCIKDSSTSTPNDYQCSIKSTDCLDSAGETQASMKDNQGKKVCPCSLTFG